MIRKIKKVLSQYPGLIKYIRLFYNSWVPPTISIEQFLANFNHHYKEVLFIQIGSNDGKSNDPIHQFVFAGKWKGLLVEPVDYLFNRLKETYRSVAGNVHFVNAAVSEKDGFATFYSIKETSDSSLPRWYDQLGSFDKNIILKHKDSIPGIENLIEEKQVPSLTFSTLCAIGGFSKFDLLHIDTEGYDYEILKMIDWSIFKPAVIIYEHRHLSLAEHKESIKLAKKNNYKVFLSEGDTVGISAEAYQQYQNTFDR